MEDAARKLKTNRNALYKLLHDARLRLKRRLSAEDISPNEVLTLFEQSKISIRLNIRNEDYEHKIHHPEN